MALTDANLTDGVRLYGLHVRYVMGLRRAMPEPRPSPKGYPAPPQLLPKAPKMTPTASRTGRSSTAFGSLACRRGNLP